ncbi:MAG: MFS transporter [Bacteroidota bacterium]
MSNNTSRLYTPAFLTLCASYTLFSASFNMIIPELPSYLSSLGGADYKGLIIALFTLTAGISRPFSGKLADTIGRIPVIFVGIIVCFICSLLYPILTTVAGFLLLRLVHGFSTGFSPTATTAYVADFVPAHRRGEAMGILGVCMNTGASISPPIGSWLVLEFSLNVLFFASSGVALLSMLILTRLKETLPEKRPFHFGILKLKRDEILEKAAFLPAAICITAYFGFGVIVTIVPDQSEYLGIANKGLFFTALTLLSLVARVVAGKSSDIYGRLPVMRIAMLLLALSYVFMSFVSTPTQLMLASGCVGFSNGIAGPAIFAMAIDRAADERRARAMATLYIGLEIAIGTGALFGAYSYDNHPENFMRTFLFVAGFTSLAFLFLGVRGKPLFFSRS